MDVETATMLELKLKAKIRQLEEKLATMNSKLEAQASSSCENSSSSRVVRPKISQMSSEVVDSNPYSRLMALKRMGIVDNYEVSMGVGNVDHRNHNDNIN